LHHADTVTGDVKDCKTQLPPGLCKYWRWTNSPHSSSSLPSIWRLGHSLNVW